MRAPNIAQPRGELVVGDDGRHGDEQTRGGGDERFGDSGCDGAQGRRAGGAEAVEGVNDTHDGAEEADEGGDRADGGEPGHALFKHGEGFAGSGLRRAFERVMFCGGREPPVWRR